MKITTRQTTTTEYEGEIPGDLLAQLAIAQLEGIGARPEVRIVVDGQEYPLVPIGHPDQAVRVLVRWTTTTREGQRIPAPCRSV